MWTKTNNYIMGRRIKPFSISVSTKEGSKTLRVIYRYRGGRKDCTDFILDGKGETHKGEFTINNAEDALKLADYLQSEINYQPSVEWGVPSFETTGYGIKILCNGKVIETIINSKTESFDIDSFNYQMLNKNFPKYSSDDYYFLVYSLKDHGLSRDTISKIVENCVAYQKAVLVSGDLRVCCPMTLEDIAEISGFDNATISRAVKGTRIFTVHRNYSLDSYVTSISYPSLFNGVTIKGERVNTFGVREKILALIETEDKRNPLTDDDIVAQLRNFGYNIARRTVVKYRDALSIPNSNVRRVKNKV